MPAEFIADEAATSGLAGSVIAGLGNKAALQRGPLPLGKVQRESNRLTGKVHDEVRLFAAHGANKSSNITGGQNSSLGLDAAETTTAVPASVRDIQSGLVVVFMNGFFSCLLVPCVCFVGVRLWANAQEKAAQRRSYAALGDHRGPMPELSLPHGRFASPSPGSESVEYEYELHPGVPHGGSDAPTATVREVRLTPRLTPRDEHRSAQPTVDGSPAGGPAADSGKKRRVISL